MTKPKAILVLHPDGRIDALASPPTWTAMQQLVGGYVEQVRVLDRLERSDEGIQPVYSYLYVNEEGLLQGLPRNTQATTIYQRNVRLAFPGHANPFQAAKEHQHREAEALGMTVLETSLGPPGYEDDPWIAGTAIYFAGWSCEEVTAYWEKDE